ncbi:MAG: hypothetical protein VX000_17545 [Myxococcota bacterium]|nr:hypothetical protein [Myxococcota bacterium]
MLAPVLLLGATGPAWSGGPGSPGVAVPLYAINHRCTDSRFPRLAGPWAVGCGPGGRVDRALSLETGRLIELPRPLGSAGTGPAAVVGAGRRGGLFRLTQAGAMEVAEAPRIIEQLTAPPATDGTHIGLLSSRGLQAFPATDQTHSIFDAHPLGWQPIAMIWPWVAWVEDAGGGDADVWIRDMRERSSARPLANGTGRQDRVVAEGDWFAWIDLGDVVLWNPRTEATRRIETRTGFRSPPAPWDGEACWEVRGDGIDIECSDLPGIARPGHQGWPTRWARWMLYRDADVPMLYTAPDHTE